MEDIDHYEIPIYNFPYDIEEDDEETIADNIDLRVCLFSLFLLLYLMLGVALDRPCCPLVLLGQKRRLK